jgi:hypothetical protein
VEVTEVEETRTQRSGRLQRTVKNGGADVKGAREVLNKNVLPGPLYLRTSVVKKSLIPPRPLYPRLPDLWVLRSLLFSFLAQEKENFLSTDFSTVF